MADRIRKGLAGVLLLCSILLLGKAYEEYKPFAEAKTKQQAVISAVVSEVEQDEAMDRKIDFKALKNINPDIVGWLYAPSVGVDYPILKGDTDTEYLTKDFDGSYSPLGSVFTWASADEKLSDSHICFFGHNMMSGQIFGQLDKYEDAEFRKNNKNLYLYTPERTKELEILEVYTCQKDDEIFQKNDEELEKQIITLATCTGYDETPYRFVVNCSVSREKLIL